MVSVDWSRLLDALIHVERLKTSESGFLSFGSAPDGGIFVEGGRICWVAAYGLQRRLEELLRAECNVAAADLARVYERRRNEGSVFGPALLAEGLIEPARLRRALRRHSAESLIRLCDGSHQTLWASRGGRGYAAQFTFSARELLSAVIEVLMPEQLARAERELAPLSGSVKRAAAFVLEPRLDGAVPILGDWEGVTVESLHGLGHWLLTFPLTTKELAATPSFVLAANAVGDTVSVWWRKALLFAVLCEDTTCIAKVTAHHLAYA